MTVMPVTILTSFMVMFFILASWTFRICEYEVRLNVHEVRLRDYKCTSSNIASVVIAPLLEHGGNQGGKKLVRLIRSSGAVDFH